MLDWLCEGAFFLVREQTFFGASKGRDRKPNSFARKTREEEEEKKEKPFI